MAEFGTIVLADGINILAAEDAGETSNFLIPNGTFFFVLLIFLVVLGVIAKWVVPPVGKVLGEREAMLAKTTADNKRAGEQVAAAQADYNEVMAGARGEASAIRDEARTEGRQVVDESKAAASGEVAEKLHSAGEQLEQTAATTSTQLQTSVDGLSSTLANRILGIDGANSSGGSR